MSTVSLRYQLTRPTKALNTDDLLAAIKALNPEAQSVQVSPVNVMGISKKEIIVSIVIAFGSAVAANNIVDAGKAISAYYQSIGIQATQFAFQHPASLV